MEKTRYLFGAHFLGLANNILIIGNSNHFMHFFYRHQFTWIKKGDPMNRDEASLEKLSMPPKIKILEALSTIGDNRIKIIDEKNATVVSSDSSRTYRVWVDIEAKKAYSNDNGTFYRKYIGYPIIAFLMLKGKLPYDQEIADKLKGIEWRKLNEKYKRYFIVEKIVRKRFRDIGGDEKKLDTLVQNVYNSLKKLELYFSEPS